MPGKWYVIAGVFILLSLALGVEGSLVFVSKWFSPSPQFVGAIFCKVVGRSGVLDGDHPAQTWHASRRVNVCLGRTGVFL